MSKNPYVDRMEKAAQKFIDSGAENKAAIDALEAKNKAGRMTPRDYQAQLAALKEESSLAQVTLKEVIITELNAYTSAVGEWAQVRGEDLPADIAVLSSPVEIDKSDIERIAERHWTNYTMQRALMDYAKARKIVFRHGPMPEKKTAAMVEIASFFDGIANIGAASYNAKVFQKKETYDEHMAKYDRIIGDGSELAAAATNAATSLMIGG